MEGGRIATHHHCIKSAKIILILVKSLIAIVTYFSDQVDGIDRINHFDCLN